MSFKKTILSALVLIAPCVLSGDDENIDQVSNESKFKIGAFSDYSKYRFKNLKKNRKSTFDAIDFFNGIKAEYQVNDQLSIYAKLGRLKISIKKTKYGIVKKDKQPSRLAYGLGLRAKVLEQDGYAVIVEPSVIQSRSKLKETDSYKVGMSEKLDLKKSNRTTYKKLGCKLLLEKDFGDFTPYAGLNYVKILNTCKYKKHAIAKDTESDEVVSLTKTKYKSKDRNNKTLGVLCGVRYPLNSRSMISLEGRLGNEKALAAEFSFSF